VPEIVTVAVSVGMVKVEVVVTVVGTVFVAVVVAVVVVGAAVVMLERVLVVEEEVRASAVHFLVWGGNRFVVSIS